MRSAPQRRLASDAQQSSTERQLEPPAHPLSLPSALSAPRQHKPSQRAQNYHPPCVPSPGSGGLILSPPPSHLDQALVLQHHALCSAGRGVGLASALAAIPAGAGPARRLGTGLQPSQRKGNPEQGALSWLD